MAVANRMSEKDRANKVFKPSPKETDKKKLSSFFPKDSIFNKVKSFRMKGRDEVKTLDADWRNISLRGNKIVLIKDNAVSKEDLKYFPKDAKAHYLEERKAKASAAEKKAAEAKEAEEKAAADAAAKEGEGNVE